MGREPSTVVGQAAELAPFGLSKPQPAFRSGVPGVSAPVAERSEEDEDDEEAEDGDVGEPVEPQVAEACDNASADRALEEPEPANSHDVEMTG